MGWWPWGGKAPEPPKLPQVILDAQAAYRAEFQAKVAALVRKGMPLDSAVMQVEWSRPSLGHPDGAPPAPSQP